MAKGLCALAKVALYLSDRVIAVSSYNNPLAIASNLDDFAVTRAGAQTCFFESDNSAIREEFRYVTTIVVDYELVASHGLPLALFL